MIVAKILEPRMGLTPMGRRRASIAMGLALAVALKRVGRFERIEVWAWRGVPDVAHINGRKVDVELGRRVDIDAVDRIAEGFRRGKWDGVTVELNGELGEAKLGVDIDIYASEYVPLRAGIAKERIDVLAEPRGHVGDRVIESFYELFDVGHKEMRTVIEELFAEMRRVALGTRPLWRLAARIYMMRDYSFAPEDAAPLWYRPWIKQMARDLYKLAPPGQRELAGLYGMRRVVEDTAPELLKYLARYCDVKLHGDALQLIPLSARIHRVAVADLKNVLTWAMKTVASVKAQKIIGEKGRLDWEEYIKAVEEELRRRLQMPS
jgi:hypothetical protein